MSFDILIKHKHLSEDFEKAKMALQEAEKALIANEAELVKAIRENPLMRHMGLMGPESDLSDYLGLETDSEHLSLGKNAPKEILPKKVKKVDPILPKIAHEEPSELFFTTFPLLEFPEDLHNFDQSIPHDFTEDIEQYQVCDCHIPMGMSQELALVVAEDALRATIALYALGVGLWDWDATTGEVYTCYQWEELIGKPPIAINPVETLTSLFDSLCRKSIEEAIDSLAEAKRDSFCLCVHVKEEDGKHKHIQLHGVCIRARDNEMLRILVTAKKFSHISSRLKSRSEKSIA